MNQDFSAFLAVNRIQETIVVILRIISQAASVFSFFDIFDSPAPVAKATFAKP